jgi:hypothetical protein
MVLNIVVRSPSLPILDMLQTFTKSFVNHKSEIPTKTTFNITQENFYE